MATLIDCAETLNCATLSGSNGVGVGFVAGIPNKIVVSGTGNYTGNYEITGNLKSTGTFTAPAMVLSNSSGHGNIEIGGPSGGYIDLRRPFSESDFDIRFITDNTIEGGGYLQASGGAVLALSGNNVGIGTKSPAADLDIRADGYNNLDVISAGSASAGSYVSVKRSGGTITSRTAVSINNYVGGYMFYGHDGNTDIVLGGIQGKVIGTPGLNDMPGALIFSTTADNANSSTERMIIDSSGNVGIGTQSPSVKFHISGSQIIQGNLNNASSRPAIAGGTLSANELRAASTSSVTNDDGFMRISAGGGALGTGKTFIDISGYSTVADMDNNIAFGTLGVERIRIDNTGSVGIGTTTPEEKVVINTSNNYGLIHTNGTQKVGTFVDSNGGWYGTKSNHRLNFFTNGGSALMSISSSAATARVGIGLGSGVDAAYQLQLGSDSAAKPSGGSWTNSSDFRLKKNIRNYTKGISAIKQINPVYYDYNGKGGMPLMIDCIGVIAQDVEKIIPECVSTYKANFNEEDEEKTELYSFNASALTFMFINAFKELDMENQTLKSKLEEKDAQMASILERLAALENK